MVIMPERAPDESRKDYMLKIAAAYIVEYYPDELIFYDEAECDGSCVADDCLSAVDD